MVATKGVFFLLFHLWVEMALSVASKVLPVWVDVVAVYRHHPI
jgi:hypothetical protein